MTRIVGGVARGRRLVVPARGVRPTSDRVREALFSAVEARIGGPGEWAGRRVLDLYAGSGAVGLEALSRGAAAVLLVDRDRAAVAAARANAATVGLPGARVEHTPVERVVGSAPVAPGAAEGPDAAYDLAFLDPPYDVTDEAVRTVLRTLWSAGWLSDEAIVVVERAGGPGGSADFAWPAGWRADLAKRYGDTALWYGRPPVGPREGGEHDGR